METDLAQRWRRRRDSYRPVGEPIETARYEVAPIERDGPAKAFVLEHHYAGSYPAARERIGLYRAGALVGVAVFSQPANNATLAVFPERERAVELGRFVLLDEVPGNGESWLLGRCFELLRREGYRGLVSFSDPVARTDLAGRTTFVGHVGGIYQATNGRFTGRSRAERRLLLPDGTMLPGRTLAKVRNRERGHEYAIGRLVAHGARRPADSEDLRRWLAEVLPGVSRPLAHGGNLRYLWGLDRATARHLARVTVALPYPKWPGPARPH